jgi:hypothetical protein
MRPPDSNKQDPSFSNHALQDTPKSRRQVDTCRSVEMENHNSQTPAASKEILPGAVYLTEEAAAVCRVQPSTIQRAVRRGLIRGKGRPFRILGSELFKLVGATS